MKKICVLGLGYIGLPTASILALNKHDVLGVDICPQIIDMINKGDIHITEPGLDDVLKKVVSDGNLKASIAPSKADVFIISVPTPLKEDLSCDLTYVINAVKSILEYIQKGNLIIVESTIPPRTMTDIIKPLLETTNLLVGSDIHMAHCPERVIPGNILNELVNNNRIIGGFSDSCSQMAYDIYSTFVSAELILTSCEVAEMSKLVENSFRDVNIAFANEVLKVCSLLKINASDVIKIANKHPRVNILSPGPGVGGHCLAVDPYFIIEKSKDTSKLISLSRQINNSMPDYVCSKVHHLLSNFKSAKISIFGLSYKENVDDFRESPSLKIISTLKKYGYDISAFDPFISDSEYVADSIESCVKNSHLILILCSHDFFKNLDFDYLLSLMSNPLILDTKEFIDHKNCIKLSSL